MTVILFFFFFLLSPCIVSSAYFEPMPMCLESDNYYFEGQKGASWGDFDNDGLLDIIATSSASGYYGYTKIFRNNGTGFEDFNATNIPQVAGQLAQWGDFDNDGDLDLVLGGNWEGSCTHGTPTEVLRNDGEGVWTKVADLHALCFAAGEWGDFDNDGYLDLGITGVLNFSTILMITPVPFTMLYRNEKGTGTFTPLIGALPNVAASDLNFGDYDNDGWLDIALLGYNDTTTITKGSLLQVFRNTNKGTTFINDQTHNAAFTPRGIGTFSWADYNADGWLDLLATGYSVSLNNLPALYTNNEGSGFTEKVFNPAIIEAAGYSTGEWGDYDNDGYPDFCYYGYTPGDFAGGIYKNQGGNGNFELAETLNDTKGEAVACVWGDYNNDGRLDVFLLGYNINGGVFTNTGASPPAQPPFPPTNPVHFCNNNQLRVEWERPSDGQGALTYNVAVGSFDSSSNSTKNIHVSPMALSDGRRLVPRMGNAQTRTFFILDGVDCSIDFQVSVQTIDASFRGSSFSLSSPGFISSASSFSLYSSFFFI